MSVISAAWIDGLRRVARVPAIVIGVLVVTMVTAAPLAMAMRDLLQDSFAQSAIAGSMADSFSLNWWQEFAAQASSLGNTFSPNVIGFALTLDNLSNLLDSTTPITPIVATITVYLGAWTFLGGGILDRYARQRPTRIVGFFSSCGVFFFRFIRLAVVAGAVYWWLFAYVHEWLFDTWLGRLADDLAVERTEFFLRVLMYVIFATLLALVNIWVDYAKVRAVVEDRRSMLGALISSLGFITRHPGRVFGLYLLNTLTFLLLIMIWAVVAPGVGSLGASMWMGFLVSQLYILARLVLKLQFLASQTALFQASLAHAVYTATPAPKWPESPSAELITSKL